MCVLQDAVKLAKDWGVEVLGRVDAHHRATDFGYLDGFKNNKVLLALLVPRKNSKVLV